MGNGMYQNYGYPPMYQINQLQMQAAMAGVVRYPNGFTYNAGNSPFCGCNS